ncbi:MAG: asparaginase [Vicinamibacteria bacterium]|jgi:L-asparaginase II
MSEFEGTVPLALVERGGRVESVHHGAVAVVDADGALVAWAGAPELCAFTRSALKPLQALPFVAAGGPEHFGLSSEQVALMCASHSGEAKHQVAVADLMRRAGVAANELGCGTHAPYVFDALHEAPPPPPYSPLGHNCSGKHAGMLAFCAMRGWPRASYLDPAHPLQEAIRDAIVRLAGVGADALVPAIDGCSAPNYAMPLAGLARAFARIAGGTGDADGAACRRIADAMAAHPDYVSGERRSDLTLMRAGRGRWIAKVGAEGMQAIGLRAEGLGIAIKVADGSARAVLPVAVAVLDALGVLDEAARRDLEPWRAPVLHNARGTAVGRVRSTVVLDRGRGVDGGRR